MQVALFTDWVPGLLCMAHYHGARVVNSAFYPASDLSDTTKRSQWIAQQVLTAQQWFLDGVNVDIEYPVAQSSNDSAFLTALMVELTTAFHQAIPGSQVTFDVAWSPNCIDERCYDYVGIATAWYASKQLPFHNFEKKVLKDVI